MMSHLSSLRLVHQILAIFIEVQTFSPVQDPETVPHSLTHLKLNITVWLGEMEIEV